MLRAAVRSCARAVWHFGCWLVWGSYIQDASDGETGIRESITLLGFVLVGTSTLFASLQKTFVTDFPTSGIMWSYLIIAMFPLGAMASILRASRHNGRGESCHLYNRATIEFTRWNLFMCSLLILPFFCFGIVGWLPGQKPPPPRLLKITEADLSVWDYDKNPKLVVRAPLGRETYPEGVPDSLLLNVAIVEPLQKKWEIWIIQIVDVTPGKEKRMVVAVENYLEKANPFRKTKYLSGFHEDGHEYAVEVQLHAFGSTSPEEQKLSERRR